MDRTEGSPQNRSAVLLRYGVALAAGLAAVLAGALPDSVLSGQFRLVPSYLAVTVSAWFGGIAAGILITLLCGAATVLSPLAEPRWVGDVSEIVGLLSFVLGGAVISVFTGAVHRIRRRSATRIEVLVREVATSQRTEEHLRALNADMERRVAEHREQLVRAERRRVTAEDQQREAEAARARAEAANRAKDEFVALLGHELRTPLGAIRNAVPVLDKVAEQFGRVQEIIGRQTANLTRLLDDLLDAARLTAGKIALDRHPVDLKQVAERSLTSLEHEGRTGQHVIALTGQPTFVDADEGRLEQVVRNLIDNAIKYTPAGGRVSIDVGRDGGTAMVRVADTGIGIPPDVLPRIFDPFVQAGRSPDGPVDGLGLGLSLVKRLVELHGGTVSASSPGPDEGSEFVVRIPGAAIGPIALQPDNGVT